MPKLSENTTEENIRITAGVTFMWFAYSMGAYFINFLAGAGALFAAIVFPEKAKLWGEKLGNWIESIEFLGAALGAVVAGPFGFLIGAGMGHLIHRKYLQVADSRVAGLLGGAVGLLGAAAHPVETVKQITAAVVDNAADLYSAADELLNPNFDDPIVETIEIPQAAPVSESDSDIEDEPGFFSSLFRIRPLRCFAPQYYASDDDDYGPSKKPRA